MSSAAVSSAISYARENQKRFLEQAFDYRGDVTITR